MSDDSQAWLDTALPLDDVGSNRVELAGRLAESSIGCTTSPNRSAAQRR